MNKKIEILLIIFIMLVAGFAHGYNMLSFPYYENDEGVYVSQGWSLSETGELAPYTYWYDHAPAGWFFILAWAKATGGFFALGDPLFSGRIFMLVLHMASSLLLYFIVRKLTNNPLAGVLSVALFSIYPLGIYFQRRVLLDNIMIFWLLSAIAILMRKKLYLQHIIASAIMYGIAVLTKETAVMFGPAFLYILYTHNDAPNKLFVFTKWLFVSGLVVSLYFVYALIKGELFPTGTFGDTTEHVSLLGTLAYQAGRGTGLHFWQAGSDFMSAFLDWFGKDPVIITASVLITVQSLLASIWFKQIRIPVLLLGLYWFFLLRGSLVLDFYILPLIALVALCGGVLLATLSTEIHKLGLLKGKMFYAFEVSIIVLAFLGALLSPLKHFTVNEARPQFEAIDWVRQNLPTNTRIVIDDYAYMALRDLDKGYYADADYFWKVQLDKEIHEAKYGGNWQNAEYVMLTHEMVKQMSEGNMPIILEMYNNADKVAEWYGSDETYVNLDELKSTNGDWVAIYKLRNEVDIMLENSWKYYKQNFIESYGQSIDPLANNQTTSEGQSYILLRSVLKNDKETFDGALAWTKDHMQHREHDRLFSWLWTKNSNGMYSQAGWQTATDAEQDIALALLFAHKRWGDDKYITEARALINDIWNTEVFEINGKLYLASSADSNTGTIELINPSYFSPAWYRMFAQVDPSHDWNKLISDGYEFLNTISKDGDGNYILPRNWIGIELESGELFSATEYRGKNADEYGYDAFRIFWRVALDARWYDAKQAKNYLRSAKPFFDTQMKKGTIYAEYSLNGVPLNSFTSLSTSAGALAVYTIIDKPSADLLYERMYKTNYNEAGYWGSKNAYYEQNWAWFGTALYYDRLPNWWKQ